MKYSVNVIMIDGASFIKYANKRPHVTDNRLHIDISTDEYTVIPMSLIRMYSVTTENTK
jgi:hypothetical protein